MAFCCTISPSGSTVGALHDHLGLDELRRPGQHQLRLPVRVADLQPVGQELVDAGDERAAPSSSGALADLDAPNRAAALLVEDAVLVVQLDQLGLLVHHQDRLGEERAAARRRWRRHPPAAAPDAGCARGRGPRPRPAPRHSPWAAAGPARRPGGCAPSTGSRPSSAACSACRAGPDTSPLRCSNASSLGQGSGCRRQGGRRTTGCSRCPVKDYCTSSNASQSDFYEDLSLYAVEPEDTFWAGEGTRVATFTPATCGSTSAGSRPTTLRRRLTPSRLRGTPRLAPHPARPVRQRRPVSPRCFPRGFDHFDAPISSARPNP